MCVLRKLSTNWPQKRNGRQRWQPSTFEFSGRGERIRTSDLSVPNRALYQAEPRPDKCRQVILWEHHESVKPGLLGLVRE
jgi:hypothetical protein